MFVSIAELEKAGLDPGELSLGGYIVEELLPGVLFHVPLFSTLVEVVGIEADPI